LGKLLEIMTLDHHLVNVRRTLHLGEDLMRVEGVIMDTGTHHPLMITSHDTTNIVEDLGGGRLIAQVTLRDLHLDMRDDIDGGLQLDTIMNHAVNLIIPHPHAQALITKHLTIAVVECLQMEVTIIKGHILIRTDEGSILVQVPNTVRGRNEILRFPIRPLKMAKVPTGNSILPTDKEPVHLGLNELIRSALIGEISEGRIPYHKVTLRICLSLKD